MNNKDYLQSTKQNEGLLIHSAIEKPLNFSETARYLNLSKTTLRKLVKEKTIRAYRFNRKVFFYASQVNEDLSQFLY